MAVPTLDGYGQHLVQQSAVDLGDPSRDKCRKIRLTRSFYPLFGGGVAEGNRALRKGYTVAKILETYSMMHRDSDASRVRKASRPNMSG